MDKKELQPTEPVVPAVDNLKLIEENKRLQNEVNILRNQITNLSSRSNDLALQNRELKEHIDKLAKSKEDLEGLQLQKDDLFAVVIHDIKNPAALIKSLVDLLRSYDLTATEQQEVIENIFETSKKIVSLSQEVTKILALESKALMLNIEEAPMNEVITDVYKRNLIAANMKEIEILMDLSPVIPNIYFDVQKIDEVVENLISNAIKYSHAHSRVKISTKADGDNLVVEISDQGLGLTEEDLHKAFHRGARLSAQPTGGESTSGFGLWVVKKLVESHKGRVWVKSVLGKGSTFSFSIPMDLDKQMLSEIDNG